MLRFVKRLFARPARHKTTCLILEELDKRLVPTTLVWYPSANTDVGHDNAWGTAHNWRMGSPGGPEANSPPGFSDTALFSGATDDTSCGNAGGSVGAISLQGDYSGTLSLSGNLEAGNSELSSLLAAGTIDFSMFKLTLQGTHDEWDACDVIGSGTVEIANRDDVARNSGVNSKEYGALIVDAGGAIQFNSTGGFDFGTTGTVTVSGTFTVQPSPQGAITFAASNTTAWKAQSSGVFDFRDTNNTITVPVGITATGSASIIQEECCTVSISGDVTLGASGGSDIATLNLWAGADGSGSTHKTIFSATGTLRAYGDSVVQQTHNSPNGNGDWVFTTVDCAVEMHDSSAIKADGDGTGGQLFSTPIPMPTMSLTGSLDFYDQAIVVVTSYTTGILFTDYIGCSYIKCATLTFHYVGTTPRYVVTGSTVANEKMKFLYVAAGTYTGTPFAAPVGWTTTTTAYGGGGMDFFCQNY